MKPYAVQAALDEGYRTVLWLDASAWALRDLTPVFEAAENAGVYAVATAGAFPVGEWAGDACLRTLGLSRAEAQRLPQVASGVLCVDASQARPAQFQKDWLRYTVVDRGAA